MTDTTDPTVCPNCQHPHHLPGSECATPVHHGPSHWHLCLCLARPGAALSCPPQMACQGGTLGYSDIWYLQQGHSLSSADGVISPEVLTVGPVSVGYPPAAVSVPAADRAAPAEAVCRFEEGCHRVVPCDPGCGTPPPSTDRAALRDRIAAAVQPLLMDTLPKPIAAVRADEVADAVLSVLPAPADRAAVLEEAAAAVAADTGFHIRYGAAIDYATHYAALLRRMAAEAAAVPAVGVAADTTPAETEAHPPEHTWKVESPRRDTWASWGATYDDRDWAQERYESAMANAPARAFRLVRATTTYTVEAEHRPVVPAQPGNDTKTREA